MTRCGVNAHGIQLWKDPGFDLLAVTYAEPGPSDVQLLGIWSTEEVASAARPYKNGHRVTLTALKELPRFYFPRA